MTLLKVALPHLITCLIAVFLFSSCQKELDRSDLNQVSVALVKALNNGDTALLHKILDRRLEKPGFNPFSPSGAAYGVQELSFSLIDQLKGKQMKLHSVSKLDGNLVELIAKDGEGFYSIRFFYRVKESPAGDGSESTKEVKIMFNAFADLNLVCRNYQEAPWKPDFTISFDKIEWVINPYNKRIIKDFVVHITNDHPTIDFDYLKFRLTLTSKDGEIFYNKTIESYEKVYSGDLSTIDIHDLDQFYSPVIMNTTNFTWKAVLIEARPKPPFDYCLQLEELQVHNLSQ